MVRLGRMETMSREVQAWHMDRVAEQRMAATGDVAAAAGMPGIDSPKLSPTPRQRTSRTTCIELWKGLDVD